MATMTSILHQDQAKTMSQKLHVAVQAGETLTQTQRRITDEANNPQPPATNPTAKPSAKPTAQSTKKEITDYLDAKGITYGATDTKADLLKLV